MTNRNTILVVDDDPTVLNSVADVMRVSGYNLLTAANGAEGLRVLQSRTPDLIVADIMMPEMDGYQFYEAVRENAAWATMPFIFLTAKGERADIRRGYSLGADYYLTKPFEPEDLLVAVESRLKRAAQIQAATRDEVESTKQQLIDIFSHELRTPLAVIYGYIELLREGHRSMDDDVTDRVLQEMHQGADRLVNLVKDLMLIVYVDSGAASLEYDRYRQRTNLSYELQAAVRDLSTKAEKRKVTLSMVVPNELVVLGCPAYLRDILTRLIDNAIKFSRRDAGQVWIRGEAQDGQAIIRVQDNGMGIAPELQEHLFERFRQIDRRKIEQQGVGLGLAIASRLTQMHGGSIEVESQPGEGSTFTLRLPLDRIVE